jgi:hypothetical protein
LTLSQRPAHFFDHANLCSRMFFFFGMTTPGKMAIFGPPRKPLAQGR